jgi:hypothetical protein
VSRALILLALLAGGCGTKVLELGPPDGGPPPFPNKFCVDDQDPNGGRCMRCYDQWGVQVSAGCTAGGPAPACSTKETPLYERCVFCGGEQRGCLKCEPTPLAESCRNCAWTDGLDKGKACTQCFDPAGKLVKDDCDAVRPDLPHPSPAPAPAP